MGKALEWISWTLLFALAQLWYDLFTHLFRTGTVDWYAELQTGILLFVVFATTVGIAVDFHLDDTKSGKSSFLKRLIFMFFPFVVLSFVFWAYAMTRENVSSEQQEVFVTLNICSLFICVVYSVFTKRYLYRRESWM
jgi:ABC-type dipeptide/oligopeptide/nickel transport system permease component